MEESKKALMIGVGLTAGFAVVLILLFSPIINGQNPINHLDNLYNSISKGSVYYIPGLKENAREYEGRDIDVSVAFMTEQQAQDLANLYARTGGEVDIKEDTVRLEGDLGRIIAVALEDSDLMFHNQGAEVAEQYGINERHTMYNWWLTMKAIDKQLTKEKRFDEAKFVMSVQKRAVECSFNYYLVEPREISTAMFLVIASLAFYVIYTLWFGFAIMYVFIGLGLKIGH